MQQDVTDDAIAKIAQAVVARIEPVVEANTSDTDQTSDNNLIILSLTAS